MKRTIMGAALALTLVAGGLLAGCGAQNATTGAADQSAKKPELIAKTDSDAGVTIIKEESNAMASGNARLSSAQLTTIQNKMLNMANKAREKRNKRTVKKASRLQKSSKIRSSELHKRWSHTRPNGKRWDTTLKSAGIKLKNISYGENLAMISVCPRASYDNEFVVDLAKDMHEALMDSPAHKKILTSSKYKYVGISAWSAVEDGWLNIYVAEHFSSKKK